MDETAQMLQLRAKDDLGIVQGAFPVFLSRWSASWVNSRVAVLYLDLIQRGSALRPWGSNTIQQWPQWPVLLPVASSVCFMLVLCVLAHVGLDAQQKGAGCSEESLSQR